LNYLTYRAPTRLVVVIWINGGDPPYFGGGLRDGIISAVNAFMRPPDGYKRDANR